MKTLQSRLALAALCLLAGLSVPAAAGSAAEAIAKRGEAYVEAFDRGDAAAVASFWMPDGTYTAPDGKVTAGREAIQSLFQEFFAANKGLVLSIESESLRVLSPDVVLESGTTAAAPAKGGPSSSSRFANTWVLQDGEWLLASVAESALVPAGRSSELSGLAWTLGRWEAQTKSGEKILLSVEPGPHGQFLIFNRTVLARDTPAAGATEWVAWDPAHQVVRSWSFNDDGGFSETRWTPSADGWALESTHTLRNGAVLQEMHSIRPGKDGRITVKSLKMTSGETVIAPVEELTFSRIEP